MSAGMTSVIIAMEGDVTILSTMQLEEKLKLLENSYAELITDDKSDKAILNQVWNRIKEVRLELQKRNS